VLLFWDTYLMQIVTAAKQILPVEMRSSFAGVIPVTAFRPSNGFPSQQEVLHADNSRRYR